MIIPSSFTPEDFAEIAAETIHPVDQTPYLGGLLNQVIDTNLSMKPQALAESKNPVH